MGSMKDRVYMDREFTSPEQREIWQQTRFPDGMPQEGFEHQESPADQGHRNRSHPT